MSFLFEETPFDLFGTEHILGILVFALLGFISIYYANRYLDEKQKTKLGAALTLIPLSAVIFRMCLLIYLGIFDYKLDLPLHLCRMMCFIAFYVMASRHRFWLGVLYFWIIAGTLNATITPDLHYGFPHYDYLFYFPNHAGLIILAFYIPLVYKIDITFRDAINALLMINVFLFTLHGVNYLIGSNYMFTMHKPPVASLMDYLGPWPWYLFTGQFLAIGLIIIAYLPFGIRRYIKSKS